MLEGKRVLLRAISREDMNRQCEFENDPEIWYWDGGPPKPTKLETVMSHYEGNIGSGESASFAIEVDGKYIGYCSLSGFHVVNRTCELQVEIGDKSYWGLGYGREIVDLLLEYAFTHRNVNRVWLATHSKNERAIRCYLACGFVEEGRLRQHIWLNGEYVDRVYMGTVASDRSNS